MHHLHYSYIGGSPAFLLQFETAPQGGLSDVFVKIFSKKLELVYNPYTMAHIMALLQVISLPFRENEQELILYDSITFPSTKESIR